MRITTLSQLLVVEEVPKWFRENGLRKRNNSRLSITFFPLSALETDLSSKLQTTIQQFQVEFF